MKLSLRYTFTETEEQARAMVDRENQAHPRRKQRATYTTWTSSSQTDPARFVVWHYEQTGVKPMSKPNATTYEIREIDAWLYDDCWVWNTSYRIGEFTTTGDVSRALRQALKRLGVTFHRGRNVTVYDGDVYEIQDRATGQPLFAAIPKEA